MSRYLVSSCVLLCRYYRQTFFFYFLSDGRVSNCDYRDFDRNAVVPKRPRDFDFQIEISKYNNLRRRLL